MTHLTVLYRKVLLLFEPRDRGDRGRSQDSCGRVGLQHERNARRQVQEID
jgi:hypothetical protein